jgi:hypothetical protein
MIAFTIAMPLQVSAVILSAAKNPEGFNQPQPLGPFAPRPVFVIAYFFSINLTGREPFISISITTKHSPSSQSFFTKRPSKTPAKTLVKPLIGITYS